MKISFVATVLNEEQNMENFLNSVINQSHRVDEIIIVDGGSTDATVSVISRLHQDFGGQVNFKLKILIKKGNRAIGRNEAIKQTSNEIIVCSDAGCILDKDWIKNIIVPFNDSKVDVVAGYYRGVAKSIFEKCLIPYVLVMPDKIDEKNFLPATRSIAFRKPVWKKAGGFPEEFSNNEDYVFARKLKQIGANIVFKKNAVVYWKPRKTLKEAFTMFYRFAKGDSESRIFRPKVVLIFARYFVFFIFIVLLLIFKSYLMFNALYFILFIYVLWSIIKNFKYVRLFAALYYLPLIQISSDLAVMSGTIKGIFVRSKCQC